MAVSLQVCCKLECVSITWRYFHFGGEKSTLLKEPKCLLKYTIKDKYNSVKLIDCNSCRKKRKNFEIDFFFLSLKIQISILTVYISAFHQQYVKLLLLLLPLKPKNASAQFNVWFISCVFFFSSHSLSSFCLCDLP